MGRSLELALRTERLTLTLPPPDVAPRVVEYYERNREFHRPWDPPRPAAFHSVEFWEARLAANRAEYLACRSLRLFLFRSGDVGGEVVGTANYTGIVWGAFMACRLGYGLDAGAEGSGFMSEALRASLAYVFEELGLHRVEANYVPTNERSGRLLERLGFVVEGRAKDYLYINGAWRDHVLTSLTNPDPAAPPSAS